MSLNFRLQPKENIAEGTVRIAQSLNKEAIEQLQNRSNVHETIHELRKRFKEIRALIRLVRYNLGEENFDKENKFYRDMGREISKVRDAKAYLEMLDKLKEKYQGKLYKNAFTNIEKILNDNLQQQEDQLNLKNKLNEIDKKLQEKQSQIAQWNIKASDFDDIEESLKKVYTRGYKALDKVKKEPSAENFHEWRKRAKYIRYQIDILKHIWPGMMDAMEDEFHELTDLTGDDHDIHNLLELLEEIKMDEEEFTLLKALASDLQQDLRKKAMVLGEKLYLDTPKEFIKRIGGYFAVNEKTYTTGHEIPQTKLY